MVERRSEEQGVEAGSSATQLAVGSQSCLFSSAAPTPSTDGTVLSGRVAPCATVWASCEAADSGGDAESGGSLRSVGKIGA